MILKMKDLPSLDVCAKLSTISFDSPKKNFEIYRLISALKAPQSFFASEHGKILNRLGKPTGDGSYSVADSFDEYKSEMDRLMELEITDDIPVPSISEDDFNSDKCVYPQDKNFWMNANDINSILVFIQKLKM